ncbi:hypothetical protein JTB14_037196 [Gonioctena quinquepunctata]|nr:hypothetical protein JTB14_037196 [Gonioctena quinquepunctata]
MTAGAKMEQQKVKKTGLEEIQTNIKRNKTIKVTANKSKIQENSEEESDGGLILESDTLLGTFSDMGFSQNIKVENRENETGNKDNVTKVIVRAWISIKFKTNKHSHRMYQFRLARPTIAEIVGCLSLLITPRRNQTKFSAFQPNPIYPKNII